MAQIENSVSKITRTLRISRMGWSRIDTSMADDDTRRTDHYVHYADTCRSILKLVSRRETPEDGFNLQPEEAVLQVSIKTRGRVAYIMTAVLTDDDYWRVWTCLDDADIDDYAEFRSLMDVLKLMSTLENRQKIIGDMLID